MYHIDSKTDKPDIQYMYDKTLELMEKGIKLGDVDKLYKTFYSTQQEIAEQIRKEYEISNPNSPKQITGYMRGLNNMEVYEICCIDGKWTSNKDSLITLAVMGYEFASDILSYRKAKKYAESIKSMMNAIHSDGMVRPKVSLGKTNRINYSDPALMNIPKKLLWNMVAPRKEGNILYSADIKNQEPSMLINILNIEQLKDALIDPKGLYETLFTKPFIQKTKLNVFVTANEERRIVEAKEMAESSNIPPVYYSPIKPSVYSVYCDNVAVKLIEVCNTVTNIGVKPLLPEKVAVETVDGAVYNVPVVWEDIKEKKLKEQGIIGVTGEVKGLEIRCEGVARKEFKQSWNAMTYGASIYGVKKMCKNIDGEAVYKYFSKIPEFKEYKYNCNKLAEKGIQNINTFFGTQLFANEEDSSRLKRVLMDLPIQGTAADILSLLIKHFNEEVIDKGIENDLEIYYTRHDELILEANKEWVETVGEEKVKAEIRDIVEHQIDDWTPFKIEVKKVEAEPLKLLDSSEESMF